MDIRAHISGWIAEIRIHPGDTVKKGTVLLIIESMKMRIPVTSPLTGQVVTLAVAPEAVVQTGDLLLTLQPSP